MWQSPVIFILGASALSLAQRLKAELGGEIHGPRRVAESDSRYDKAPEHLQILFRAYRPIIGLCASGILIRALAPCLSDKLREPPVIAVAEDGSSVVPLLGGHHGANELSEQIAEVTGGRAAITTASDIRFGVALDDPPEGYVLANPQDVKSFATALLNGEKISIEGEAPWLIDLPQASDARLKVTVTERNVSGDNNRLVYHPQCLVLGVGCERHTSSDEVIALAERCRIENGLARHSIAMVASIDLKMDEQAINDVAKYYSVPVRFFRREQLLAQSARLENPSDVVMQAIGTPGVAEAACLAAFAPNSYLVAGKVKSKRATCAIANGFIESLTQRWDSLPVGTDHTGVARGSVILIGIGPGGSDARSREASVALGNTTDWVGYSLYLDLVADVHHGQTLHPFPLGAEEERVKHAIALAKEGKQVALICSGDPAIYAMASLVYEIIDREPARIAVEVIPGVSAFQAASAKAGAMIGHDFCCISLSDLLTPWETIERRLRAAAEGDFVVALYNPRSEKRRDQLDRAVVILREHRPETTPVIVASNLGRKDESVAICPLCDFDSSAVDMLTIVLVGSSQSKSFARGDGHTYAYTPRGYAAKREASA